MSNTNVKNIFDEYDNSKPVSSSLENEHLIKVSIENAKKSNDQLAKDREVKNKKNAILNVTKKVEESINKVFEGKLTFGNKIKIDLSFTASIEDRAIAKSPAFYKDLNKENSSSQVPVCLNVNIKKLSKLPALEAYAVIYSTVHKFVEKELVSDENKNEKGELIDSKLDENEKNKSAQSDKEAEERDKAINFLADYLEKFLQNYFPDDFKEYVSVSKFIATKLVDEMGEGSAKEILSVFFDVSSVNESAIKNVKQFMGLSTVSRLDFVRRKATELAIDPNKSLQALNYEQQYEELLSVNLKDKFNEAVAGYDPKNKNLPLNQFKDFCVAYANTFMRSNGLKGIEVTFSEEGELGTFIDRGNSQRVNINLSKIKSISELAMTLSHELTHAVDSSINKVHGVYNREGGGLLDSISEDTEGSGLKENSNAHQFLERLQKLTYHINPNEIHARIGELSALKFMENVSKDSPELQNQISKSVERFIKYQTETINIIENANSEEFIKSLRDEMNALGNIPQSAKDMMRQRIDYLEQMAKSKSVSSEALREAIKVAQGVGEFSDQKDISQQIEQRQM